MLYKWALDFYNEIGFFKLYLSQMEMVYCRYLTQWINIIGGKVLSKVDKRAPHSNPTRLNISGVHWFLLMNSKLEIN